MPEYLVIAAVLAASVLYGAWREMRNGNTRDGRILAACGAVCAAAGAAAWFA